MKWLVPLFSSNVWLFNFCSLVRRGISLVAKKAWLGDVVQCLLFGAACLCAPTPLLTVGVTNPQLEACNARTNPIYIPWALNLAETSWPANYTNACMRACMLTDKQTLLTTASQKEFYWTLPPLSVHVDGGLVNPLGECGILYLAGGIECVYLCFLGGCLVWL